MMIHAMLMVMLFIRRTFLEHPCLRLAYLNIVYLASLEYKLLSNNEENMKKELYE